MLTAGWITAAAVIPEACFEGLLVNIITDLYGVRSAVAVVACPEREGAKDFDKVTFDDAILSANAPKPSGGPAAVRTRIDIIAADCDVTGGGTVDAPRANRETILVIVGAVLTVRWPNDVVFEKRSV